MDLRFVVAHGLFRLLGKYFTYHARLEDNRQAFFQAVAWEHKLVVIQPQQVQDRGMPVGNADTIFDRGQLGNRETTHFATAIRRQYGLEASQCVLGHSQADVIQIYVERDMELAARVAREVD